MFSFFRRRSPKELPNGSPEARRAAFWEWFDTHRDAIAWRRNWDELSHRIEHVHPDLTFEMRFRENRGRTFVISADGMRQAFPEVRALVAAAPALEGWEFVALRPRREIKRVGMPGQDFVVANVRCRIERNGDKLDIDVYAPGYDGSDERGMLILILLDSLLGEEDVEAWIGHIAMLPIERAADAPGQLRPISELADEVDRLKAERA